MKTQELETLINLDPFRPFSIWVSSGTIYNFQSRRDIGATKDCSTIFYFGDKNWTLIDADNITEVIHEKP